MKKTLVPQGEVSKLAAIVYSNGFKDLREMLSILIMEGIHELHHCLTGLAVNTEGKVGLGLFLQQREHHSPLTGPLSNYSIALPVTFFHAERGNLRAVGNACTITLFVLSHTMLLRFALQCLGQFRRMEGKTAVPDHVVESPGTDHLGRLKQTMKPGIAAAGIQGPLVFPELLSHPVSKTATGVCFRMPVTRRSVSLVDGFSQCWGVARCFPFVALSSRCASP